jgi:hypothetical protein
MDHDQFLSLSSPKLYREADPRIGAKSPCRSLAAKVALIKSQSTAAPQDTKILPTEGCRFLSRVSLRLVNATLDTVRPILEDRPLH